LLFQCLIQQAHAIAEQKAQHGYLNNNADDNQLGAD
jgi:hypothetical protein